MFKVFQCLCAILMCSSFALAASVPAGWESGTNYTYQAWDFATAANPSPADAGYINAAGVAVLAINTPAASWENGIWFITGPTTSTPAAPMVAIQIPNIAANRTKYLWLDIVFQANADFTNSFYMAVVDTNGNQFSLDSYDILPVNPEMGVFDISANFSIFPQPSRETILLGLFNLGANEILAVDSIKVATVCPEPATMGILAIGSLLAFRKRR